MPISATRGLLRAALDEGLRSVEYRTDPVFGFEVPEHCPGVPEHVLKPESSWADAELYWTRYRQLAQRFVENFKKFEAGTPAEVIAAGPRLEEPAAKR
jgi:phosphoenolpyruvate carboxykinase (ATP)